MRIHLNSDVHIEFDREPTHTLAGGETLLLAGDVCVADLLRKERTDKKAIKHRRVCDAFFKEECAKYEKVYMIMGNHEHYHGVFDNTAMILREYLQDTNVTLLDKEWVRLNDHWELFGGTMWTDYDQSDWFAMQDAKNKMNDHRIIEKIKQGDEPVIGEKKPFVGRFLPEDAVEEYRDTVAELVSHVIDHTDTKKIVMTHHAPCAQSIAARFQGMRLNAAYYTEMSGWIMDQPDIKYWFHGHMHDSFDYIIGDCRVVCNPRGYAGYELNEEFDKQFEVVLY